MEHWDGHAWSVVTIPIPTFHAELIGLASVSAVNAHDIWAVGQGHLTEHWDGKDRWIRYTYDKKTKLVSAEIDPDHKAHVWSAA